MTYWTAFRISDSDSDDHAHWETLEAEALQRLLAELGPSIPATHRRGERIQARKTPLAFFPGCDLYELVSEHDGKPLPLYLVHKPGSTTVLDNTNEAIYQLVDTIPVSLTDDTVRDYVRFFFSHVGGQHGRFLITEDLETIRWTGDADPQTTLEAARALAPVHLDERSDDGTFKLTVTLLCGQ